MTSKTIKIIAISGSLRANSSTHSVLQAIETMVPETVDFNLYKGLANLPHFDDRPEVPQAVQQLRSLIKEADGVLICTPEYAFGVPGSLKNALDWTVSSGEFVDKPVALITAATGGEKAHASLMLTFSALSAKVPADAGLLISFIRAKLNKNGDVSDPETLNLLQNAIKALINSI